MKPGRAESVGAHAVRTILLVLVPAHAAGLLALAAFAAQGPEFAGRAVAVAFGTTLVAGGLLFGRRPPVAAQPGEVQPGLPTGRGPGLALLLAAVVISFVITFPRLGRIDSQILGNTGDSGLVVYLLEWQVHAAAHDPGSYFDPNIFAPESFTLFWGPSMIPLAPPYALLRALTGSPIAAFNLLMVGVSLATLAAGYAFLRRSGFAPLVAALGGLLYATTAQRLAHLGHLDSFQTLWIPVFATLLLRSWRDNRTRDGILLGGALGCSLLAAPYYFLSGLGFIGFMVVVNLRRWLSLPWRSLTAGAGVTLVVGGPVLVLSRLADLDRGREDLIPTSWADFYHPGAFTPAVEWLADAASRSGGGVTLENWLFSSIVMVALAAVGAVHWLGARRAGRCPLPEAHPPSLPALLVAAGLSGIIMASGPYLRAGSHSIPLPALALLQVPGFDGARATGRFIAPAFLALTVVALVGVRALTRNMRRTARAWFLFALALTVLATTQTFQPTTALDVSGAPTAVNRALSHRPSGLVVELPWPSCPGTQCLYTEPPRMIWSRYDWNPRLGGYSGYVPDYWPAAGRAFARFPDRRGMDFLKARDVRYVILRVSTGELGMGFTAEQAGRLAGEAAAFPEVGRVERFGADYLLTLR